MRTILIVGKGFNRLQQYLLAHDFNYILLKDAHLVRNPHKLPQNHLVGDFSSNESLLKSVDELVTKHSIDAVVAIYENYILPTAVISEHLGLLGLPLEAVKRCTDKFLMRLAFADAAQKVSPDYSLIVNEASLLAFANSHEFPLILKPANLAKSLLVTKNHNIDELLKNYHETIQNIEATYLKHAPHQIPKLLIEEFMEGSIHSVDAFIDSSSKVHVLEEVVDYQTGYDIGYDDNFHYSRLLPSKLSTEQIKAVRQTAVIGCEALGMKNSPAHVEIILTKNGPRIVEIGARNGGYRERMHSVANGIDIVGNQLRVAFGKQPKINATRNDYCAVLELFPKTPGVFTGINNEKKLRNLPSLAYYSPKVHEGDIVGKSSAGHKMCAVIMLHNKDKEQFNQDLDFVNNQVRVTTKD